MSWSDDLGIFDREGRPMSYEAYCARLADEGYQVIEQTVLGPYFVSTVWLGLDHGWGRTEKPVIFETMVFLDDEVKDTETVGVRDMTCVRYSTEEEARQGHEEMVVLILATSVFDIPAEDLERAQNGD